MFTPAPQETVMAPTDTALGDDVLSRKEVHQQERLPKSVLLLQTLAAEVASGEAPSFVQIRRLLGRKLLRDLPAESADLLASVVDEALTKALAGPPVEEASAWSNGAGAACQRRAKYQIPEKAQALLGRLRKNGALHQALLPVVEKHSSDRLGPLCPDLIPSEWMSLRDVPSNKFVSEKVLH